MGKYLITYCYALLLVLAVSCAPSVKPPQIPERYMKRATKEEVFEQAVVGVSMIAGGIDRATDQQRGYIKSRPFKPRIEAYKFPTLHILEAEIRKKTEPETGKTYYLPEFHLSAVQSEDLKAWGPVDPPESYKIFLESSMQERVIVLVSGYLAKFLPPNHYLGFIIRTDKEPLYTSPTKKQIYLAAGRYQFGELQFQGFKSLTVYKNGLLQVKFWLHGGDKRICWVDEDAVKMFMFEVPNIAGTAEVWKANYKKAFIKAVTKNIGILKGTEEKWPGVIMHSIMSGTVTEGMTEEQAVAAAGPPDDVEKSVDNTGHERKVYIYKDNNVVLKRITFSDGKVVKVFSI